jgi:hypothetical protein
MDRKHGKPELCLRYGHDFTPWGPYIPIKARATSCVASDPPFKPKPERVAYRERLCGRCGVVEEEDYADGSRKVVADPRGIEAYRVRATAGIPDKPGAVTS